MAFGPRNDSPNIPLLPSIMRAGLSSSADLSALSMVAYMDYVMNERQARGGSRVPSFFQQLSLFWAQYRKWRTLRRKLGVHLDIPCSQVDDLLVEVQRHRWIEAEKAGRDIWASRSPRDPETSALRDWFSKHYDAWRAARAGNAVSA